MKKFLCIVMAGTSVAFAAYALTTIDEPLADLSAIAAPRYFAKIDVAPPPKPERAIDGNGSVLFSETVAKTSTALGSFWDNKNRRVQAQGNSLVSVFDHKAEAGATDIQSASNFFFGGYDEGVLYELPQTCMVLKPPAPLMSSGKADAPEQKVKELKKLPEGVKVKAGKLTAKTQVKEPPRKPVLVPVVAEQSHEAFLEAIENLPVEEQSLREFFAIHKGQLVFECEGIRYRPVLINNQSGFQPI
ncbi:hypothetical protein E1162_14820 [Rhodobacteraceae bacterium RKSG542]|uniref:hypothetical protein n=1 Tax=Pseudovibrio flavus TaxID=2529854 RepID=UPI0012BD813E|nr:hypothetical protein [Pseudovibrio flavus]MTI18515.1 hypothetical protein [Pseudovibrio flavus]